MRCGGPGGGQGKLRLARRRRRGAGQAGWEGGQAGEEEEPWPGCARGAGQADEERQADDWDEGQGREGEEEGAQGRRQEERRRQEGAQAQEGVNADGSVFATSLTGNYSSSLFILLSAAATCGYKSRRPLLSGNYPGLVFSVTTSTIDTPAVVVLLRSMTTQSCAQEQHGHATTTGDRTRKRFPANRKPWSSRPRTKKPSRVTLTDGRCPRPA